jgi:TorA maturation chaperone TorD
MTIVQQSKSQTACDDAEELMPTLDLHIDQYRANIYGILSHIYMHELTDDFVQDFLNNDFISKLIEDLDILTSELELDNLEKLSIEYTRLFIGPSPHVAPYASVHYDTENLSGQIWGSITGEIKRFIEFHGLYFNSEGVIPDHVSILYEFMEKIIRSKVSISRSNQNRSVKREKRNKAYEIQRQFFLKYIDPWIDSLFSNVLKANPHVFYKTVVDFNKNFIELERKLFSNN